MGRINVLSFAVANLIAAGEVVDRPASVIKELLENAIDAGATEITVEIRNGGVTFMRVTDNGCGIAKEDLPIAIRRHATSKIKEAEDLDGILTLGFRGEALAAIAAVSDLRIITKTRNDAFGSLLTARAGEVLSVTEQGAANGTTVIVENLFANVPARRKFLKKDVSEAIAVTTYTEKIALSHPEIALRLIVDGTMKLNTAGDGKLQNTMYAVFGRDFAAKMIPVRGESEGIKVSGFISRPDHVRPKRNYENFFINGRFINSRTAAAALEQAYTSFIPPEKFPCCVLMIEISPKTVDVNVHPAKLEVKFSNEKPVFEAVYYAVRSALEGNVERPNVQLGKKQEIIQNAFVPIEEGKKESLRSRQVDIDHKLTSTDGGNAKKAHPQPFERMSAEAYRNSQSIGATYQGKRELRPPETSGVRIASPLPITGNAVRTPIHTAGALSAEIEEMLPKIRPDGKDHPEISQKNVQKGEVEKVTEPIENAAKEAAEELVKKVPWRLIGTAFNCYIIAECEDRLFLIDQHAAHERILFEDLKKQLSARKHTSQLLLVPFSLSLSTEDVDTLTLYREEVRAIGFSFTVSGNTVSVNEIPTGMSFDTASALLESLAAELREGTVDAALARDIIFEKALYQSACKAAIKGGRQYSPEHLQWICNKLSEIPDITVCPHGRPVAMVLTHASIDRQFERT